MSSLNYSIPSFQLLIGGIDFTRYFLRWTISPGFSHYNSYLNWQGEFELCYPDRALISEEAFSEIETPTRWRRGLSPITLKIRGVNAIRLRIEDYRYDDINRVGTGSFTQMLGLLDFERPALPVEGIEIARSTPITTAVTKLLLAAGKFDGTSVLSPSQIFIPSLPGEIDTLFASRNPIQDAQKLCGIFWKWLWVDNNENIRVADRPTTGGAATFRRGSKQVEITPASTALHFAAEKVIATGTKQVVVPYRSEEDGDESEETPPAGDGTPQEDRPLETVTETTALAGVIFPDLGVDTTEKLKERKKIKYTYDYALKKLIQTETERNLCAGLIFPDLGTNFNLRFGERITETETRKKVEKPAGVLFPDLGSNFSPLIETDEKITNTFDPITFPNTLPTVNPRTGRPQMLEREPRREERQLAPEVEFETKQFKGVAHFRGVGWSAFLPRVHIENVGFFPDQATADRFATAFGLKEHQRSESSQVTMPIPQEWVVKGCKPFPIAHIHNRALVSDAPILSGEKGQAELSFTGDRLGKIPVVPNPTLAPPVVPEGGLAIVPIGAIELEINTPMTPLQLVAYGGAPPYTFSGTMPGGFALSASGIITGGGTTGGAFGFSVAVSDNLGSVASFNGFIGITDFSVLVPVEPSIGVEQRISMIFEGYVLPLEPKVHRVSMFLEAAVRQAPGSLIRLNAESLIIEAYMQDLNNV